MNDSFSKNYKPAIFALRARHGQQIKEDHSTPFFPSFSLPPIKPYSNPFNDFQNQPYRPTSKESDEKPKITYARELQSQIDEKRLKTREERDKRRQQDKADLARLMEYNPFGKPGNGAPYRDKDGNIIATRKKPYTMTQLDRNTIDATNEIPDNPKPYLFYKDKTGNVTATDKEYKLKDTYEQHQKYAGYANIVEAKLNAAAQLKEELDKQTKEKQRKKVEEHARRLEEEKKEEIKIRNELRENKEKYEKEMQIKRKKEEETTLANQQSAQKRSPVLKKGNALNTSSTSKLDNSNSSPKQEMDFVEDNPLIKEILEKKPIYKEALGKVREETMERLSNKKKLDDILHKIEKSIQQKSSENSSFYQSVMGKILSLSPMHNQTQPIERHSIMDKTLKGETRLIPLKEQDIEYKQDDEEEKKDIPIESKEISKEEAKIVDELDVAIELKAKQTDANKVISQFDSLLTHINSL